MLLFFLDPIDFKFFKIILCCAEESHTGLERQERE